MSTSFIEQTNQSKIDCLLDDQNELQGKIQQVIKNYGKDSADRRHRVGDYAGTLEQLRELWQKSFDLDEEVQQAALPTGCEHASRLIALKELVKKISKNILCGLEEGFRRPPDELQPTSILQLKIKSKETPRLIRLSDS